MGMGALRELVCRLVEVHYDADTRRRFEGWLRAVEPVKGDLAVMLVEMAIRHTPIGTRGEHRYALASFDLSGEPLIELHTVQ